MPILNHEGLGGGTGSIYLYSNHQISGRRSTRNLTIHPVQTCIYGVGDTPPFGEADDNMGSAPYECDTLRTFTASASNCLGRPITNFEHTLRVDGQVRINKGKGGDFQVIVEPNKVYEVTFWAFDDCGNSSEQKDTFQFKDCTRPAVYLIDGIALTLGAGDSVLLWAADVDNGSWDNCTPQNQLDRRIAIGTPNATTLAEVKALGTSISLTCLEVGQQEVSFYVVDAAGNFSTAITHIDVQDNSNNCNAPDELTTKLTGHIQSFWGNNVGQVEVEFRDSEELLGSMLTTENGQFDFTLRSQNLNTQKIRAKKDIEPLNGVSTFDLILISKHILGTQFFDNPYQYIAADVNRSGAITAFDLVQLRQLILNQISDFPNNESWRFIDAQYQFTTPNPASEAYREWIMVKESLEKRTGANFIAVKIGDVNDSGNANNAVAATDRTTKGIFVINAINKEVVKGEVLKLDFKAKDISNMEGFQFGVNFSDLELIDIKEGILKAININSKLAKKGRLLTSWNGKAEKEKVLYALTFKAKADGWLSDLIKIESDQLVAEAYSKKGGVLSVKIDFITETERVVLNQISLHQNTPNPFTDKTIIEYYLPKDEFITLSIFNAQGKIVKQFASEMKKGQHQFSVDTEALDGSGIYYYQLKANGESEFRKMILVE